MKRSRFESFCWSVSFFLLAGCAATAQITNTPRSSIEQELLVRALDRAMAKLDTRELTNKTVMIDFYGRTPGQGLCAGVFYSLVANSRGTRDCGSQTRAAPRESFCL